MSTIIFPFDHGLLVSRPDILDKLVELYIRIWQFDPNFQEYKMCPACRQYYSYEQVEVTGTTACQNGHESVHLVNAWEPEEVSAELLEVTQRKGFYGVLVVNAQADVVGFAWAEAITMDDIRQKWGPTVVDQLLDDIAPNVGIIYFDELALDLSCRGIGLGKNMVHNVCEWMRDFYPDSMALLRTHANSPARIIYERIGFEIFADDPEHGDGRVLMKAHPCKSLVIEMLN